MICTVPCEKALRKNLGLNWNCRISATSLMVRAEDGAHVFLFRCTSSRMMKQNGPNLVSPVNGSTEDLADPWSVFLHPHLSNALYLSLATTAAGSNITSSGSQTAYTSQTAQWGILCSPPPLEHDRAKQSQAEEHLSLILILSRGTEKCKDCFPVVYGCNSAAGLHLTQLP